MANSFNERERSGQGIGMTSTQHCPECERLAAEVAKAERSHDFTRQWYAERIERLSQMAKDHGIWPEAACIIANGTASAEEPPTYALLLNSAKHRADRVEAQRDDLQRQAEAMQAVVDAAVKYDEAEDLIEDAADSIGHLNVQMRLAELVEAIIEYRAQQEAEQ